MVPGVLLDLLLPLGPVDPVLGNKFEMQQIWKVFFLHVILDLLYKIVQVLPVYQDFPLTLAPQENLYFPVGQKMKNISWANGLLLHFEIKN